MDENTPAYPSLLQVRNEISVLKRVSKGHPNIVTLHDYFEVRPHQNVRFPPRVA